MAEKKAETEKPDKSVLPVKQAQKKANGKFAEGNTLGRKFKPGVSGNPAGPPKGRVQLWRYFGKFMGMTEAKLEKLDREKMTLAELTALKLVENMKDGKSSGSERLARHVFDREEGKPIEHFVIENENVLSDEECEEIRQILMQNAK